MRCRRRCPLPPRKRPWFRFYVEAIWDRKLRRLPPAQRWVWVAVLALARHSPKPGVLLLTDESPVSHDDIADAAAVQPRLARAAVKAFLDAGMLDRDESGCMAVTKWDERQFESDETAKRTRKHRDGTSKEPTMERSINGDVAPQKTEAETRDISATSSSPLQSPAVDGPDFTGDEDAIAIQNHWERQGHDPSDVAVVVERWRLKKRFGEPVRDPGAWFPVVLADMERARLARNGDPKIAEVGGMQMEFVDGQWQELVT